MNKKILSGIGILILTIVIILSGVIKMDIGVSTASAEVGSRSCQIVYSGVMNIGHQLSTTLFSTTSNRAYVKIAAPDNATNTIKLSFGATGAANIGTTLNVPNLNGASSTPSTIFGLNTEFPFTGPVYALTDNGSSTIDVISCVYNQ